MSKSDLALQDEVSVPRLELMAAVLAVKLDMTVKKELKLDLLPSLFWTDSSMVLKVYEMIESDFLYSFPEGWPSFASIVACQIGSTYHRNKIRPICFREVLQQKFLVRLTRGLMARTFCQRNQQLGRRNFLIVTRRFLQNFSTDVKRLIQSQQWPIVRLPNVS